MAKRAVLHFDIFYSFEHLLSPCMFARFSILNKRMWRPQNNFMIGNIIHVGSGGKIMLIALCQYYETHIYDFYNPWANPLIFGFKSIYNCLGNKFRRPNVDCTAIGGHKKLWLYYFAKRLKLMHLYFVRSSFHYAAKSGHLEMCKFLYHLNKQKKQKCTFLLYNLKTDFPDVNEFIASIRNK